MKKIIALILCSSFLYLQAEDSLDETQNDTSQCVLNINDEELNSTEGFLTTARIKIGEAFGKYIGIRKAYTELGFFGMVKMPCDTYTFLETRGFLLTNQDWVASIGLGFRKPLCTCSNVIVGANIYYDYENAKFSEGNDRKCCHLRRKFESIGIGFEILSNCIDFRTNAYLPVSGEFNSRSDFTYPGGYELSVETTRFIQYGIDAEIGKRCNFCSGFYAEGALGGYGYFYKHTQSIYGPFARLEVGWGDYISLQGRYSYDKHYHSSAQGKILLSLPIEQIACCFNKCCICFDPIIQPVQRNYIPFVRKECSWNGNW